MRAAAAIVLVLACYPASARGCTLPGLGPATEKLQLPAAGEITTRFGPAYNPLTNRSESHNGIDIESRSGERVIAPAGGFVTFSGYNATFGNSVEIAHGGGYSTSYAHLSESTVREGDCVSAGVEFATTGCTGLCSRPHLHFEVRKNADAIDPAALFDIPPLLPLDAANAWTTVDRSKLLDAVINTVEQDFIDTSLVSRIDWSEKARASRPGILLAPTSADAVRRINDLLGLLETSHTELSTPDDPEYYILRDRTFTGKVKIADGDPRLAKLAEETPALPGIGLFTVRAGGRHHVDGILEGSPAAKAGLKFGDEILAVDGAPYHPVASFLDKAGAAVKLTVRRRAGGDPEVVQVPGTALLPSASAAFTAATAASARLIGRNGKRIGYVRIWGFHDTALVDAVNGLESGSNRFEAGRFGAGAETKSTGSDRGGAALDYLIVDARGKVGGSAQHAEEMLRYLAGNGHTFANLDGAGTATWHSSAKDGLQMRMAHGDTDVAIPYRSRSVLLIDHHTRSAGEIFASAWKTGKFGPVFGTRTRGAVTGGAATLMPGGLLLRVGKRGLTINGEILEGKGVEPDVTVERPLAYAEGADPVLEAAIAALTGLSADTLD